MRNNRFSRFRRGLLWGLVLLIAALAGLILLVHYVPVLGLDYSFTNELQEHKNNFWDNFMVAISFFGYSTVSIVEVALASLLFYFYGYRKDSIFCLLTLTASGLSYLAKIIIHRPRPGNDVTHIIKVLKDYSFPSGHVTHYMAFFGFLVYIMIVTPTMKISIRALVSIFSLSLIALIPFSRVYLGEHWLTDVIGGYLFGLIDLGILIYFYNGTYSLKNIQ